MTSSEKAKNWRRDNPEKWAALKARRGPINGEWARRRRASLRLRALAALGDKCVRCAFTDDRALQIDHVGGGGIKELKAYGHRYYSPKGYLETVITEAESGKYQLLCANCNWIKRSENHEHHRGRLTLEDLQRLRERRPKFSRRNAVSGQFVALGGEIDIYNQAQVSVPGRPYEKITLPSEKGEGEDE